MAYLLSDYLHRSTPEVSTGTRDIAYATQGGGRCYPRQLAPKRQGTVLPVQHPLIEGLDHIQCSCAVRAQLFAIAIPGERPVRTDSGSGARTLTPARWPPGKDLAHMSGTAM